MIDTPTVPLACAGVIACNCVELTTRTDAAATPPKATEADWVNPVPETVTKVPPDAGPLPGPMPLIESWVPEWPQPLPGDPVAKFVVVNNARTEKTVRRQYWRLPEVGPNVRILNFPFLHKFPICASAPPD